MNTPDSTHTPAPDRLADQITVRVTAEERSALEGIAHMKHRSLAYVARVGVRLLIRNPASGFIEDEALPDQ